MGCPGTGKSTIVKELASKMKCKFYHLDDLLWKRKYDIKRDHEELIEKLKTIIKKEKWVIEGTSRKWVNNSFEKADLILFLDLPIKVITFRLIKRYLHRKYIKKEKNMETLIDNLKLAKVSHKIRSETEKDINSFKSILNKHKGKTLHLKTQKEIDLFIENFKY